MELTAITLVILFVSTLIRATFGFGDALTSMPLLTLVIGIQVATPLVALVALTIAAVIVLGSWREIEVRDAWRLVLSSFVGIPLGLVLLKFAPEDLIVGFLGLVLILFGLYRLLRPGLPWIISRGWAYPLGFLAGMLGGAYNTNGPPIVLYGSLRGWTPERFRATLQGYFLMTSVLIVLSHGIAGLWTARVLRLYLLALPVILLAILLGSWLNARIPAKRFEYLLFVALILLGVLLLF